DPGARVGAAGHGAAQPAAPRPAAARTRILEESELAAPRGRDAAAADTRGPDERRRALRAGTRLQDRGLPGARADDVQARGRAPPRTQGRFRGARDPDREPREARRRRGAAQAAVQARQGILSPGRAVRLLLLLATLGLALVAAGPPSFTWA